MVCRFVNLGSCVPSNGCERVPQSVKEMVCTLDWRNSRHIELPESRVEYVVLWEWKVKIDNYIFESEPARMVQFPTRQRFFKVVKFFLLWVWLKMMLRTSTGNSVNLTMRGL